ncbi:hypothetical protein MKY95_18685 [Paenibacillus sp. FSL P4-0176]|uniref:hypothetical protein n=1 Tax=Paenibacillus sp. FSL P4-0176 TaxID=2921631 RepID=UPI0030D2E8D2
MIVKNEVVLHEHSVSYMKRVFMQYSEIETLPSLVENPILHLYPVKDTYELNGELNGYNDSLFFNLNVYDPVNRVSWKSKQLHDGIIPFSEVMVQQIKIFKDLSTMVSLSGSYRLSQMQGFSIGRLD